MEIECTFCRSVACFKGEVEKAPQGCRMRTLPHIYKKGKEKYLLDEEVKAFQIAACYTESQGYKRWSRIRELVEFSKFMGFKKIGIAHCIGLLFEASLVALVLKQEGFEVIQIMCKTGAIHKEDIGVPLSFRLRPEAPFEAACNPVVQAEICNAANTDLNVLIGLCLGHDILFTKYSKAPVTTLIVKDRTNGHNPASAIYSFYQRSDLLPESGLYPPLRFKLEDL